MDRKTQLKVLDMFKRRMSENHGQYDINFNNLEIDFIYGIQSAAYSYINDLINNNSKYNDKYFLSRISDIKSLMKIWDTTYEELRLIKCREKEFKE